VNGRLAGRLRYTRFPGRRTLEDFDFDFDFPPTRPRPPNAQVPRRPARQSPAVPPGILDPHERRSYNIYGKSVTHS